MLPVATVVIGYEIAAEKRLDAEDAEVRGGNGQAAQMLRTSSGGKVVADRCVSGDVLEEISVLLQAHQLRRGDVHFIGLLFVAFREFNNAVRLGKRERAQEHAVDDGEDGGVRADAESERQYG